MCWKVTTRDLFGEGLPVVSHQLLIRVIWSESVSDEINCDIPNNVWCSSLKIWLKIKPCDYSFLTFVSSNTIFECKIGVISQNASQYRPPRFRVQGWDGAPSYKDGPYKQICDILFSTTNIKWHEHDRNHVRCYYAKNQDKPRVNFEIRPQFLPCLYHTQPRQVECLL